MVELLMTVGDMSLTAALTVLVVIALRWVLVRLKAPAFVRLLLWGVVLFRMVCPVSFTSTWSAAALVEEALPPAAEVQATREPVQQPGTAGVPAISPEEPLPEDSVVEITTLEPSEIPEPRLSPMLPLALLWLAGVAFLWGWWLYTDRKLKKRMETAVQTAPGVFESDQPGPPFVLGFHTRSATYAFRLLVPSVREDQVLEEPLMICDGIILPVYESGAPEFGAIIAQGNLRTLPMDAVLTINDLSEPFQSTEITLYLLDSTGAVLDQAVVGGSSGGNEVEHVRSAFGFALNLEDKGWWNGQDLLLGVTVEYIWPDGMKTQWGSAFWAVPEGELPGRPAAGEEITVRLWPDPTQGGGHYRRVHLCAQRPGTGDQPDGGVGRWRDLLV